MMPDTEWLNRLSPDVGLLLWTADEPLSENTLGFHTLNYLLDGLVRQPLQQEQNTHQVHFIHQLYGSPFYVCFINLSQSRPQSTTQSLAQLVVPPNRRQWMWYGDKPLTPEWQAALEKTFGAPKN